MSFHATRQYRSAIIARACYYDAAPEVSVWARRIAAANRSLQPAGELPVMERIACAMWRAAGEERLEIPRAIAALAWILGAIPLYRIAARLGGVNAALIGAAIYLFLPYGIVASRSFQPDPLMTCCALWALLALVRHAEHPGNRRMLIAAGAVGLAGLIKPMSVFMTVPVLIALAIAFDGRGGAIRQRRVWLLLVLGVLAPALYYGYSAVVGTLARDQMQTRFVPSLVGSSFFWSGWWTQIDRVLTAPLFFAGIAGAFLARPPLLRALLIGLFAGYALFAFVFTYHMPTHDYYHLPYIAAVALGVTSLCASISSSSDLPALRWAMAAAALAIAVWGSVVAWPRLAARGDADRIARFEAIGDLIEHDARVVFLDSHYGYPLMYHGQISGDTWPNTDDLLAESFDGRVAVDARRRFVRDYTKLRPRYFVVTDLESFAAQPDLRRFLDASADVIANTATDRVYRFGQHSGVTFPAAR